MKILKLYALFFQRNGVAGEPFYTALIKFSDGGETFDNFLATFRTEDADTQIDQHSCRVANLANVCTAWRGDEFAYMLQKFFNEEMVIKKGTIYDCCTKQDLYTK